MAGSPVAGSSTTASFKVPSLGAEYDTGTLREAQRKEPSQECQESTAGGSVAPVVVVLELEVELLGGVDVLG